MTNNTDLLKDSASVSKDIEILKKYEESFNQASHNYLRGLLKNEIDEMSEIGEKYGIILKKSGCSKCLLSFIQKLSVLYYNLIDVEKNKSKKKCKKN